MNSSQDICVAVVDDDESLCRSLSRFLRAAHFLPTAYLSAEAFLADRDHPAFDCLILDVQLTGMSGLELSRKLASREDCPPIVFITALDEPGVRLQAESSGCAGFLHKTDSGQEVLSTIRRAIGLDDPRPGQTSGEKP